MRPVLVLLILLVLAAGVYVLRGGSGGTSPASQVGEVAPERGEGGEAPTGAAPEAPWFVDVAGARGITLLNRTGEPKDKQFIMSAVAPGVAVFDANGDGRMDFHIPNGSWLVGPQRDQLYQGEDRPRDALYIQQPDGTFVDEAKARGVDDDRWSFGACACDLDDDGDQDLIVTNIGRNRLFVNDGTGHFTDAAEEAGIAGETSEWSTGIACADYDRDGRLDIYIANYADMFKWMQGDKSIERDPVTNEILNAAVCKWQGLKVYCGPQGLPGQQDHLYRGLGGRDGAMRFADVTKESGVFRDKEKDRTGPLYGFQPLFTDLNGDGWLDIYVANDSCPSFFFESRGDGTFRECASEYAIALGEMGEDLAGMGADTADINNDGLLDILKTNFALQTNNIYVAERDARGQIGFRDYSTRAGVKKEVYNALGWGVICFDYDHDGDRDLFFANGHVYPQVDDPSPDVRALKMSFEQLNMMFRNEWAPGERLRLVQVTDRMGPGLAIRKSSRGAGLADVDNDGDLDILVTNLNDTPDLLINERGNASGHWLQLLLRGNPARKSNRDAIGSFVVVRAGPATQTFETRRGQSFLGCHDPRVHIGLGAHAGEVTVEIRWPNGEKSTHAIPGVDRHVEIVQE